jgi:hypothetical protein
MSTTITKDSTSTAATVNIKEDSVSYNLNGKNYIGFITYDANKEGKRPGILVVHEWWGLTNYTRNRAKQLAELGYIAMAVEIYELKDLFIACKPKSRFLKSKLGKIWNRFFRSKPKKVYRMVLNKERKNLN